MFRSNEELDGTKDIGGTEAVYVHSEPDKETLTIFGPLTQDIVIYVSKSFKLIFLMKYFVYKNVDI